MVFSSFSRLLLSSAIVVTGLNFAPVVTSASAEPVQLHEFLFGKRKREKQVRPQRQTQKKQTVFGNRKTKVRKKRPAAQAVAPAKRKVAKKKAPARTRAIQQISGPSYYTYKAEALTKVAISSLLPDLQTTGAVATVPASETEDAVTIALPPLKVLQNDRFAEAVTHAPEGALMMEGKIAEAIRANYAKNPDFIWVDGMHVSNAAKAVVAKMEKADEHGLDARDYAVAVPADTFDLNNPAARNRALIAFEMELSARVVRYAMDMKDGVVNPNKLSGYHDFTKQRLAPEAALTELASAEAPLAFLETVEPKQPDYKALQATLAELKKETDDAIVLPDNLFLRPGQSNEALPLLMKAMKRDMRRETREKHAAILTAYAGGIEYTPELVELVRDVQRDHGLKPDGIVGPRTAARLGGDPLETKIERVKLSLERLRWHPEEYGRRQVVINQPEYRVRYMENGETKLAMNTIVGKPSNQTYFFHDEIETVVYNPYWGVPQSIIVNEMLPKLHRDPGYLDRAGYVVTSYSGKKVSSSSVNWWKYSGAVPYNIRQKPGPKNALGELKILFPNSHAIYMHDTPARNLFSRSERAFSHGCVRLEDPRAMAAAVLGKSRDHVSAQLGGSEEKGEQLKDKVPIYVGYFTAWPNEKGDVGFFPDIYDRDSHLTTALGAVADVRKRSES